jgi:transcriptional regulator with XRE-family HTH domain
VSEDIKSLTNLYFLYHSDNRRTEAAETLKQIMEKLGYETKQAFADAFGVDRSTVTRWLNGTRKMATQCCEALEQLVAQPVSENQSLDEEEISLFIPHDIPYERIRHLWMISELLNDVGSEVTLEQALECLAG